MTRCLFALVILLAQAAHASDLSYATEVKIQSKVFQSERNIFVKIPDSYSPDSYDGSSKKYPVLYVLHGQWDTLPAVATLDLLENDIPGFILVGIEGRGSELLPEKGKFTKFAKFLEQEVLPHMKLNYAIADYSVLTGHSNSGRFVMNQWLSNDKSFSAFYSFSPSLDDGYILDEVKLLKDKDILAKAPLTMTLANEGEHMQIPFAEITARLSDISMDKFASQTFPGESHRTSKHPAFKFAPLTLLFAASDTLAFLQCRDKNYANDTARFRRNWKKFNTPFFH